MSRYRQPSSPLRYLLARLRPLILPQFWAPALGLVLLGLFTWELWGDAEWFNRLGVAPEPQAEDGISPEDRALGAEIDSTPILTSNFGLKNKTTPEAGSPDSKPGIANPAASPPAFLSTPLPGALGPLGGMNSGLNGLPQTGTGINQAWNPATLGGLTPGTPTGGATPANNLAAAMAQTASSNARSDSNSSAQTLQLPAPASFPVPSSANTPGNQAGVNSQVSPVSSPALPATAGYTNSYTTLTQPPVSESSGSIPGNPGPVPTLPTNIPNNFPSGSINQFPGAPTSSNDLNRAYSPNFNNPQAEQTPAPLPFSAPRSVPGRYIGGGQINTFSNP